MQLTRKNFVLRFLVVGYAFHFVTRILLNQAPEALFATPDQAPWQRQISAILVPFRIVLIGPVDWLLQDPDPPPPFRLILMAVYWSLLALGLHFLWSLKTKARNPDIVS